MQVIFNGHPFLFVNPKYEGKYLPPDPSKWFNYGGDKLWLLPEGNDDEQHWVGNSDLLDDGPYAFRKVSEGKECEIELTSPIDPQTGIQIRRTIHLDADSPRIRFHATMQNKTGHVIEWSMQSVSQYDTADPIESLTKQPEFLDLHSCESIQQLSQPLSRALRPGRESGRLSSGTTVFSHCTMRTLQPNCGWTRRQAGWRSWMATVGMPWSSASATKRTKLIRAKRRLFFGRMVPRLRMNSDGEPSMTSGGDGSPCYLEAEINSPLVQLRPGETRDLDTEWFPTRAGGEFHGVEDAGVVVHPLQATRLETTATSGSRVPLECFSPDVWLRTFMTNTAAAWEPCL